MESLAPQNGRGAVRYATRSAVDGDAAVTGTAETAPVASHRIALAVSGLSLCSFRQRTVNGKGRLVQRKRRIISEIERDLESEK